MSAAAPAAAAKEIEIEVSVSKATESSVEADAPKAGVVQPRMSRTDDDARLRGGLGLKVCTGLPLKTDDNFCRYRCCCCENGCTELKAQVQYLCLKVESGGNCRVEEGIPCKSKENFCKFKCFCVESGCTVFEVACQFLCLKIE